MSSRDEILEELELEEEENEEEETEEKEPDYSDWGTASLRDIKQELGTTKELKELIVPLPEIKKVIKFYLRELSVSEQLKIIESFYQYDKEGNPRMNYEAYYRNMYMKTVSKSTPPLKWREAKYLGNNFLKILLKYFPTPFELETSMGMSEREKKN